MRHPIVKISNAGARFRVLPALVLTAASLPAAPAGAPPAHANTNTTLILHAIPRDPANDCFTATDLGMDCIDSRPHVTLLPGEQIDVYLFVRNFDEICGLQCAFDWTPSWQFLGWGPFADGACLSQALAAHFPTAAGPREGALVLAFDQLLGGFLTVVGYLGFVAGQVGCVEIIEPEFPDGLHVVDCTPTPTAIGHAAVGRVCVREPGVDACDAVNPVLAATWAQIKAAYRN